MSETEKTPDDRDRASVELRKEHEEMQDEVQSVLADVIRRLDTLSDDLRKRGAFPVASQIERRRSYVEND